MSNLYPASSSTQISPAVDAPRLRITAGSAFKLGFFGALGLFVFYLIISVIFGIFAAHRPGRRAAAFPPPAAPGVLSSTALT